MIHTPQTPKKIITKIPANPLLSERKNEYKQIRVAAYCRVSTDSEDQLQSYKAQVAYYTDAIAKNPRWKMVDIYADEGLTGTRTEKRVNFNRMMRDCERGRIDFILTKSVARFARNTVDSLKCVRKLKAKGIGVFFEEQNLDSLKTDNEMLLGMHSVMAQAESENISANVRWGIQQRMKSGTFKFRYNLLGYAKGEDGQPMIVEEEAVHVRRIYDMYLEGSSISQCCAYLMEQNVLTHTGKTEWKASVVQNMLQNEKYCGDLLMQKTFVVDCISKKKKKNRGEMPKYLITDNHPAIISRDKFRQVQMESARRSGKRKTSSKATTENGKYSAKYALSELLYCGECGSPYRRRTWKDKQGNNTGVWICLNRTENGTDACPNSLNLHEEQLHEAICRGLRNACESAEEIKELMVSAMSYHYTQEDDVLDIYAIKQQLKEYDQRFDEIVVLQERTTGDKARYENELRRIAEQMMALRQQLENAESRAEASNPTNMQIQRIKELFADEENFSVYDDKIVRVLVECIRVMEDKSIVIVLKGGYTVTEQVEDRPRKKRVSAVA